MNKEILWNNITEYGGDYLISNTGMIKSLKYGKERILAMFKDSCGYSMVTISFEGKKYNVYVHKLVYSTFINKDLTGYKIYHKDGNKNNNSLDNLDIIPRTKCRIDQNINIDISNEIWKTIEDYDNCYQISNKGRIRSNKNNNSKMLSSYINDYGYLTTTISYKGKLIKLHNHRIVCYYFKGIDIKGKTIHHIDGNKLNNSEDNLEIMFRTEHSRLHGFTGINGNSRSGSLTKKQFIEVKMLIKLNKLTINEIASLYNISHVTVSKIKAKDTKDTLGI
jgi:hypothetical protein